jgi:hypothetical protein
MALESEIGIAMTIDELSFERSYFGNPDTIGHTLNDFQIYLGLCASDQLGTAFDDNFVPGTKTLVYSRSAAAFYAAPWEWIDIPLDAPYWYNGQDNLLMEINWSSGYGSTDHFLTWHWDAGPNRTLYGDYGTSTGTLGNLVDFMMLTGTLGLEQSTFGGIKTLFVR